MRKKFIFNILILETIKKFELTKKEKLMLYGLVKYPELTDKQLSEKLDLKHSTVTSIRHRLKENEYLRKLIIPKLQSKGCEMLVVIYTNFSPLIPLEERVEITGKAIEVFDEIFFSVGEQDKGFSLSLSKDYASIGKINDIRTQTFGGRGLLEEEYPNLVVFPFEISKIYRFFDFSPLLKDCFKLDLETESGIENVDFGSIEDVVFSDTEKNVYCILTGYPELSDSDVGRELGVSRHTISRLRRKFKESNLMSSIILPNYVKLGFEILAFYHIRFDPRNPPNMENDETAGLMSDSTVFLASRRFEAVLISIYKDYDDYKSDMMKVMQILKENQWIAEDPRIRTYSLGTMVFIKDFKFAPIASKIVGCDFWVKKLLNM
ncbi:MAG: helix-turn-helix domain-containing protein [Thermoplasmatales archaeon]|nr:MAG: helix-turn-helix domain-containing protein [Thermoplasmatales archaeon]